MPNRLPTKCKQCGAHARDGARISRRALCDVCGPVRQAEALASLRAHRGPVWKRYVAAILAAETETPGGGGEGN